MTHPGQETSAPPSMDNMGGATRHRTAEKEAVTDTGSIGCVRKTRATKSTPKVRFAPVMEDTANICIYFDIEGLDALFERLEVAKVQAQTITREERKKAQRKYARSMPRMAYDEMGDPYIVGEFESPDEEAYTMPGTVEFGGEQWIVRERGFGGEDDKPYFAYVLQHRGITIALRNHTPTEETCNALVELGSIPLTEAGGLPHLWPQVVAMLQSEGIMIRKHVLSRVDQCCDVMNVPVIEFVKRYTKRKFVSRARRFGLAEGGGVYGNDMEPTGFWLGVGLQLRIYDKIRELVQKQDDVKHAALINCKWGQPEPVVTRIEFECKRKAIKSFLVAGSIRIDTVEEYIAHRASLWKYCMKSFFRMTQGHVDRDNRHQDRAATWALWERITRHGVDSLKGEIKMVERKRRRTKTDLPALGRQAVGCVVKQAVYQGRNVDHLHELARAFNDVVTEMDDGTLERLFRKARKEHDDAFSCHQVVFAEVWRRMMERVTLPESPIERRQVMETFARNVADSLRSGTFAASVVKAKRHHRAKVGDSGNMESA